MQRFQSALFLIMILLVNFVSAEEAPSRKGRLVIAYYGIEAGEIKIQTKGRIIINWHLSVLMGEPVYNAWCAVLVNSGATARVDGQEVKIPDRVMEQTWLWDGDFRLPLTNANSGSIAIDLGAMHNFCLEVGMKGEVPKGCFSFNAPVSEDWERLLTNNSGQVVGSKESNKAHYFEFLKSQSSKNSAGVDFILNGIAQEKIEDEKGATILTLRTGTLWEVEMFVAGEMRMREEKKQADISARQAKIRQSARERISEAAKADDFWDKPNENTNTSEQSQIQSLERELKESKRKEARWSSAFETASQNASLAKSRSAAKQDSLAGLADISQRLDRSKGEFVDARDGRKYKFVKIGNQTWMAENLNYAAGNSWCYDNQSSNCDTYGRLYAWDVAFSACPRGWHLPTNSDWNLLERLIEPNSDERVGEELKASSPSWNGRNTYHFAVLPAGVRYIDGTFGLIGDVSYIWTATLKRDEDTKAWIRYFSTGRASSGTLYYPKTCGLSVRCLKD